MSVRNTGTHGKGRRERGKCSPSSKSWSIVVQPGLADDDAWIRADADKEAARERQMLRLATQEDQPPQAHCRKTRYQHERTPLQAIGYHTRRYRRG